MTANDHQADRRSTTLDEHVRRLVDGWPPLTSDQLDRLAVLLRPVATVAPAQLVKRAA